MRNKKGFIVATAAIMALVLSIITGAYLLSLVYKIQVYNRVINSTKSYYIAASAYAYAIAQIYYSDTFGWSLPSNTTIQVTDEGDTVDLSFNSTEDVLSMRMSSQIDNTTRVVTCDMQYVPSYYGDEHIFIVKWNPKLEQ